jgi:hypothetical protein
MFPDDGAPTWTIPLGWTADNVGRCRSCGAPVMWCVTPAGKKAPVNPDGTSHFSNCPDSAAWRQRKGA